MDSPTATRAGSPVLSAIFFVLGLAALALTITGNAWFGMSLADDSLTQKWQGGTAVYIDIMVAALAGACGWLFSRHRFVASTFVGLLALTFASMSAVSLIGLGAAERVAKSRAIEIANQTAREAAESTNIFSAGAHERNLSWLRKEASNPNLSRTERRELRKELIEATKLAPPPVTPQMAASMADPQAEFIAAQTGISTDKVQMIVVTALAILLIVGKGVCFWLSGFLSRAQIVSQRPLSNANYHAAQPLSNVDNDVNELPETRGALPPVDNLDDVEDFGAQENAQQQYSTLSLLDAPQTSEDERLTEVQRLGAAIREDVNRHVFDRTILAQFLAERTRPRKGRRVLAANLYAAYVVYAKDHNYSVLSQNLFGRLCTEAGLQRSSNRRAMDYLDLVLVDEAEAGEAPQALVA